MYEDIYVYHVLFDLALLPVVTGSTQYNFLSFCIGFYGNNYWKVLLQYT